MRLPVLTPPRRVREFLARPSGAVFRRLLPFALAVLALAVLVGEPLEKVWRSPFTALSPAEAICSPIILCTAVSFVLLWLSAWVLAETYRIRRARAANPGDARVWLFMCLGFCFLTIDEVAFVHEGLDKLTHLALGMKETAWTDRIDDAIPLVYALIGLAVMWRYRRELRQFPGLWAWVGVGMVLLVASQALDALTNRKDILWLWLDSGAAAYWWAKLNALEEGLKVLAEAVFLGGFLRCREVAQRLGRPAKPAEIARAEPLPVPLTT